MSRAKTEYMCLNRRPAGSDNNAICSAATCHRIQVSGKHRPSDVDMNTEVKKLQEDVRDAMRREDTTTC